MSRWASEALLEKGSPMIGDGFHERAREENRSRGLASFPTDVLGAMQDADIGDAVGTLISQTSAFILLLHQLVATCSVLAEPTLASTCTLKERYIPLYSTWKHNACYIEDKKTCTLLLPMLNAHFLFVERPLPLY
jgi:hypothetical protein